jgi:purine-binding chemotaxis protein CheW
MEAMMAKKKAATTKDPTKKHMLARSRSAAPDKTGSAETVAQDGAQSPARAAKKRSVPAAEPQSIEVKGIAAGTGKMNNTILADDSPLDGTVENQDVVRFILAGQVYGLPVMQIVQVLRIVAFNVVPDPPDGMLGVIDFRGRIIPLIDLHRVFGLPSGFLGLNTPVLVARVSDRMLGLVVDEVVGVSALSVGVQVFTNGRSKGVRYISGVARLDGKTMLIVNLQELEQQFPDLVLRTT